MERLRGETESMLELALQEIRRFEDGAKTDLETQYHMKQGALKAAEEMKQTRLALRVQEDIDGMKGDMARQQMCVEPLNAARKKLACAKQRLKVIDTLAALELPYMKKKNDPQCAIQAASMALQKQMRECINTRDSLEEVARYVDIAHQDAVMALGGLTMAEKIHDTNPKQGFRESALMSVYQVFDWDGNETVSADELYELGVARRHLSHRHQTWTEEMNARLVKRIDTNKDGIIDPAEFVKHFAHALPQSRSEFEGVIAEFMEVADHVAEREKLKVGFHLTKPPK